MGPLQIDTDDAARQAIATRFDLAGLDRMVARLDLAVEGRALSVSGEIAADVIQRCVATGDPLPAHLIVPVAVRFEPVEALEAADAETEVELGADDLDIVGYRDGRIDLGDMLAETLALALDPFPRGPDADAWLKARGVLNEEDAGAFGALAQLRNKLTGEAG